MAWVYILQCADGTYYVGSARDLDRRISQHQSGKGSIYTARRQPVQLVFAEEFSNMGEAHEMEKQIQGWGRAKREALIKGEWDRLPELSRKSKKPPASAD